MSEVQTIVSSIKKSQIKWFVASLSSTNGDVKQTQSAVQKIVTAVPFCNIIGMSAGINRFVAVIKVPEGAEYVQQFIDACSLVGGAGTTVSVSENVTTIEVVQPAQDAEFFPITFMEQSRAKCFAILKKNNFIEDEDSEDDGGGFFDE